MSNFRPEMSGFNELIVAENRPFIQAIPVNGFMPANFLAFTSAGASLVWYEGV